MRIIAGEYGGRHLNAPSTNEIRPTTDRVRESLFSILTSRFPDLIAGARVIDLFAGTGALGLEALSRGADFALFVECSRHGQTLIRKNINDLQLKSRTSLISGDATKLGTIGKLEPFNLAFADPPYGKGLAGKAAMSLYSGGWLMPGAILVTEDRIGSPTSVLPHFTLVNERTFGDTLIRLMKFDNGKLNGT